MYSDHKLIFHEIESILANSTSNIFDVFAALYQFCNSNFLEIDKRRKENVDINNIHKEIIRLQQSIIPDKHDVFKPLEGQVRQKLLDELKEYKDSYKFKTFIILRAIDDACDDTYARSLLRAEYHSLNLSLNTDTSEGYVYSKYSPISEYIDKLIIDWEGKKQRDYDPSRHGIDKGIYLQNQLHNLVYVKRSKEIEIEYGILSNDFRFIFPTLDKCKIAAVPLIKNIKQLKFQAFDLDIDQRRPYLILGISNENDVIDNIIDILKKLNAEEVNVAIIPELSTSKKIREIISSELGSGNYSNIKLLIMGSFHEELDGKYYNTVYALGPNGNELWRQNKFQPFTLMRHAVQNNKNLGDLGLDSQHESYENIELMPRVLRIRDTPLGRMAILICSDMLLRIELLLQMLIDLNVNFVVVPAMTGELNEFYEQAKQLAIYTKATTIVSNSCVVTKIKENNGDKLKEISFLYFSEFPYDIRRSCNLINIKCSENICTDIFKYQLSEFDSLLMKI